MSQVAAKELSVQLAVIIVCILSAVVHSAVLTFPNAPGPINRQSEQENPVLPRTINQSQSKSEMLETNPPRDPETDVHTAGSIAQCSSFVYWHDLGNNSFPRFIKEQMCGQERCFVGLYRCKPVYYTMSVLKHRTSQDEPEDDTLPGPLRSSWLFEHIDISIGCTCGL